MPIVCECITVKIQFDNTRTCKYSIILIPCSVAMRFGPPYSKILGSAPGYIHVFALMNPYSNFPTCTVYEPQYI